MNNKTVFAIGRWMPIHLGHKEFLTGLAREFGHLVIGIGSCFENGTPRNCIPAIEREKLLLKMLKHEGLTNVSIVHVSDKPTFEEWISDVCSICKKYNVTHFCTGNKEDILNVMEKLGISLDMEMINPEVGSSFPYHATDVRNAILNGEYDRLEMMIPAEIKPMVEDQVSREIRAAARGDGQEFIPGRQTVDLVFLVKNTDGKIYALIGKRDMTKTDFPGVWAIPGGGIEPFESPITAAVRCFLAETGLSVTVTDNSAEPAAATFCGESAELHFTGIYASEDERINGTRGGGSQCFAMCIDGSIDEISKQLHSTHDLEEIRFVDVDSIHSLTLAYDQKRMLINALNHLGIHCDNGELLEEFGSDKTPTGNGVSRSRAHSEGILHGASHTYICKNENGNLMFLLQRRSLGKDSYPGCLDISSAGHVEYGSDFTETAVKELFEELGLTAEPEDLTELFTQTVDIRNTFRGKEFIDREINTVYLLKKVPDVNELRLQEEELSEVVWVSADKIMQALCDGDPEFCLNPEEFARVVTIIKDNGIAP